MTDVTFIGVLKSILEAAVVIVSTYYIIKTILPYAKKQLTDIVTNKGLAAGTIAFFGFVFVLTAAQKVAGALSVGSFLTSWFAILDPAFAIFADLKQVLAELYTKAIMWIILAAGLANAIANFFKIQIVKKK